MLILYKESCEQMYLIDTVHEKANIKIVCQDIFDMLDYLFVYESRKQTTFILHCKH